jgi:D-aminopeptidase
MSDVRKKMEPKFDSKAIEAVFEHINQCQLPGAVVGVQLAGAPVYRMGFGLASIELPMLLTPDIRMRIYSITKQFTCLAYLLLCEEGAASPDDSVGRHLPELHPVTQRVTARQLMGHTSGLRDAHEISWSFSGTGHSVRSDEVLQLYREIDDVNAGPGETWSYNNGGFLILTSIIERITGRCLEDVFRERIFEPLGMHDTLLRRVDTNFVPRSATMHAMSSSGEYNKNYMGYASAGEGGIVSTVNDMLRWLSHMGAPRVGTARTWEAMKRAQVLSNGTYTGYGLGLLCGSYRGVETLSHSGGALGANAHVIKTPSLGLDIVVMSNRNDVSSTLLANKILDAFVPGDDTPVSTSEKFATGLFCSTKTGRVIELFSSDSAFVEGSAAQQIVSINGADLPMRRDADGSLRPAGIAAYLKYIVTVCGEWQRPSSILFNSYGETDNLNAVAQTKGDQQVSDIEGRFSAFATRIQARISKNEGRWWIEWIGSFGSAKYSLRRLSTGLWRANSDSSAGILSFDQDGQGFRYSTLTMSALVFRRIQ